jgi:endo-1,4-beta-xylanase
MLFSASVVACSQTNDAGVDAGSERGGAPTGGAYVTAGMYNGGSAGVAGNGASGAGTPSVGGSSGGVGGSTGALGGGGNGMSGGGAGALGGAGSSGGGFGGSAGKGGAGGSNAGGAGGSGGSGGGATCALPARFQWKASQPVMVPISDATHDLVAVKDPTVLRFNDRWHVYASMVTRTGVYGTVYKNFADWAQAASTPWYYMDQTPGFNTYTAAPQLFYFRPRNLWYLIFQSGPPMYSTASDPSDPARWTRPAPFFATEPPIITQNDGWLDFWVICDSAFCHLFFSDDHGRWYKSRTPISSFPAGFSEPVVVMQDAEAGRLFEGSNVYKVGGSNRYLALIEAFDSTSNWKRYFRSFTAESLEGPWMPHQDSGSSPFASASNVTFDGTNWAPDISHGELVRYGYDETLTIDACRLEFLFQSFDIGSDTSEYNRIPWKLGLLTPR